MPSVPYTKPGEQYVFGHFPHTCFPMGSFLSFPLCGDAATGVPGPMQALVATVLLRVPLYKHVFAWLGCHPADKPVMLDLLRENSVGVIVEGVAGIFLGPTRHQERVYLKKRKGFVKAAIQAGKGKKKRGKEEGDFWEIEREKMGRKRRGVGVAAATKSEKHLFLFPLLPASFSPLRSSFLPFVLFVFFPAFPNLSKTKNPPQIKNMQTSSRSTTSAPPSSSPSPAPGSSPARRAPRWASSGAPRACPSRAAPTSSRWSASPSPSSGARSPARS